jgi:hypothetical protein
MPELLNSLQEAVTNLFGFLIAVTGFTHASTCGIDLLLIGLGAASSRGVVAGGRRVYSRIRVARARLVKR